MLDLLIPSVFSPDEQGFLKTLIEESKDQRYVAHIILERLGKDPLRSKILPIESTASYFFAIALTAPFEYADEEPYEVTTALSVFEKRPSREYVIELMSDIEQRKINHRDAGRVLFRYTTMFPESIRYNMQRRGAPDINFYVGSGIRFYDQAGKQNSEYAQTCEKMANHFEQWRSHFLEHVVLNPN
jgi:hypothetical protein